MFGLPALVGFIKSPLFKYLLVIVAVLGLLFSVYRAGENSVQKEWDLARAKTDKEIAELKVKQGEVTIKEVQVFVDRIKIVKEKGDVIEKFVDRWITAKDDASCVIPTKFVRLHDGAAQNTVPDAAGELDESASGVALSTVTKTVTGNYEAFHEVKTQLISLQNWVRNQAKLAEKETVDN